MEPAQNFLTRVPSKFLRSSIDYDTMVLQTSECLKKVDVEYVTNGHDSITEFEVTQPVYFRLVLEPNKTAKSTRTTRTITIGKRKVSSEAIISAM